MTDFDTQRFYQGQRERELKMRGEQLELDRSRLERDTYDHQVRTFCFEQGRRRFEEQLVSSNVARKGRF